MFSEIYYSFFAKKWKNVSIRIQINCSQENVSELYLKSVAENTKEPKEELM